MVTMLLSGLLGGAALGLYRRRSLSRGGELSPAGIAAAQWTADLRRARRSRRQPPPPLDEFIASHRAEVEAMGTNPPTATLDSEACDRWLTLFLAAGFKPDWVIGSVNGERCHNWLEIDGVLFDPDVDRYGTDEAEYEESWRCGAWDGYGTGMPPD